MKIPAGAWFLLERVACMPSQYRDDDRFEWKPDGAGGVLSHPELGSMSLDDWPSICEALKLGRLS